MIFLTFAFLIVVAISGAFSIRGSEYALRRISLPSRLEHVWGLFNSPLYDAFESDPSLKDAIEQERSKIRAASLTASTLKNELLDANMNPKSFLDRDQLEYQVALSRVKTTMKRKTELDVKVDRAFKISEALNEIKKLSDSELVNELHKLNIQIDKSPQSNRRVYESQLALAKLELGKDASFSAAEVDGLSIGKKITNTIGAIDKFAKKKTSTTAEMTASNYLKEDKGGAANNEEPKKKAERIDDVSLKVYMEEVLKCKTFDEIVKWGMTKPREVVYRLLILRGQEVPYYAPHSSIVRYLADSIMSEKNLNAVSGDGDKYDYTYGAEKGDINKYSMYAPEKALVSDILNKVQSFTSSVRRNGFRFDQFLESFDAIDASNLQDTSNKAKKALGNALNTGFTGNVVNFVKKVCNFGTALTMDMARWAGGKMLTPTQTLFITLGYCIAKRKGPLSFLGALVMIRLLRIVVTDSIAAVSDVPESGAVSSIKVE